MKKRLIALALALTMALGLSGCGGVKEHSTTIFAMDTVMTLTACGSDEKGLKTALSAAGEYLTQTGRNLSVTNEQGEIHAINAAGGESVPVCDHTARLLGDALELCERTGGALDITAYPAVKAWGFTGEAHRVVPPQERAALAANIDYAMARLEGDTVTLGAGMELDLGAVAKGGAGDYLREMLARNEGWGVTSALLDLGQSTIVAIGTNPQGKPWRIGIQDPNGESYLGVLELADQSMGSSGNYQRYFEEDGVRYGHIIDPDTAAPAQSGLAGVTVVASSALLCDGLSTALFVMGLEEGLAHWEEYRDFEAVFIEENGDITLTAGLKDSFSVVEGYAGEVDVRE